MRKQVRLRTFLAFTTAEGSAVNIRNGKRDMIQIDGFYLYGIGHSLHPLEALRHNDDIQTWMLKLFIAQGALEGLLQRSVFQLKTSSSAGFRLLSAIRNLTADPQKAGEVGFVDAWSVTSALNEFEHVLTAEFGLMNIYLVLKKRGYDTSDLIHNGIVLFPEDLGRKVPESVSDINQATRCVAFELPTAAGFHLHRANESVLHRWYESVAPGEAHPSSQNIGEYLRVLNDKNLGSQKVRSALKDLKDLHRNPLIHPQDSLDSIDEAIALMGSIQSVMVPMLKDISEPRVLAQPAIMQS